MAADKNQLITFFHGPESQIDTKISEGVINGSDVIFGSENDSIIYVDKDKQKHEMGSSRTKEKIEVNLGGAIGGLEDGAEIPANTSLDDFIRMLTQKAIAAQYTQPGVTCRASEGQQPGNYEVGTEISMKAQGLFTKNDAGELEKLEVFKVGVDSALISGSTSPQTTDTQTFKLGDETVSFKAKATYGEGDIKNNNLGQPSPDGHIEAGSKESAVISYVGKRNMFYGTGVGTFEVSSTNIRALANKKLAPANGNSFTINVAAGQQYVVIAYPKTLRKMTKCFYVEQNTDLVDNFVESDVSVEGANSAATAEYRALVYTMAIPAAAGMTLNVTI